MTHLHSLSLFYRATISNGSVYILHKLLATIVSLILFSQFSPQDYALLSSIQAYIFLALLCIDGGLRKSLPRFYPIFSRNDRAQTRFLSVCFLIHLSLLLLSLPLIAVLMRTYASHLVRVILLYYLAEGMKDFLRLIFYSRFWNNVFNTITASLLIIQSAFTALVITQHAATVYTILLINAATSLATVTIACLYLVIRWYKNPLLHTDQGINTPLPWKALGLHTAAMHGTMLLKSMSERNVLVPLFAYALGPESVGIYKVASDGALLLYRVAIKAIDTADTTLLAHAQLDRGNSGMSRALEKLTLFTARGAVPLLGFGMMIAIMSYCIGYNSMIITAFTIMMLGYGGEFALSSYERALEVRGSYRELAYAYTIYVSVLLITYPLVPLIGLIPTLLLVQSVRLVSSCYMAYAAQREYKSMVRHIV